MRQSDAYFLSWCIILEKVKLTAANDLKQILFFFFLDLLLQVQRIADLFEIYRWCIQCNIQTVPHFQRFDPPNWEILPLTWSQWSGQRILWNGLLILNYKGPTVYATPHRQTQAGGKRGEMHSFPCPTCQKMTQRGKMSPTTPNFHYPSTALQGSRQSESFAPCPIR